MHTKFFLGLVMTAGLCWANTHVQEKAFVVNVTESPEDLMVPSEVWDLLSEEEKPHLVFVPMAVQLVEKTPGVLKEKDITFQFPRGGGAIDLSRYVNDIQGSFYVKFEFEPLPEAIEATQKIYFISQNRKRKLDGEILGSGCNSFFDVKPYVTSVNAKSGILVNTTRMRHLSVLGGTFLFANVSGKNIRLAQVTFTDKKEVNSKYFCEHVSKISTSGKGSDEPAESL